MGLTSDANGATARGISVYNATFSHDTAVGGEIRTFDIFHQFGDSDIGVVQHGFEAIYYLSEVVRGNIRGHAYGDPEEPLIRSEGILEGNTRGSFSLSS